MPHSVVIPDFVSKNGLLNKSEGSLFSTTGQFPITGYHKELDVSKESGRPVFGRFTVHMQMLFLTLQGCVILDTSYLLKKSLSTGLVFHSWSGTV
jgi:hypothetical protein